MVSTATHYKIKTKLYQVDSGDGFPTTVDHIWIQKPTQKPDPRRGRGHVLYEGGYDKWVKRNSDAPSTETAIAINKGEHTPRPSVGTSIDLLSDVQSKFYDEFVNGSSVPSDLFRLHDVVPEELVESGGEVSRPLHDALNWSPSRWKSSSNFGVILKVVDIKTGDLIPFQVKLLNPIYDPSRNRVRKYENPINRQQVGGFSCVTREIWQKVSERSLVPMPDIPDKKWYGLEFWNWVIEKNIDIFITEGLKKSQALLGLGYCAIALSGITMGRNNVLGEVRLQDYLDIFATKGRNVYFVFDAETKSKTKFDIYLAQTKTGKLFSKKGCNVKIIDLPLLPNTDKTGVDDFIVAKGSIALASVIGDAKLLFSYQWVFRENKKLLTKADLVLNSSSLLSSIDALPKTGIIQISSGKGTEKTKLIARETASDQKVVNLAHLVSLGKTLSEKLDLDWRTDLDSAKDFGTMWTDRVGLCIHSLLAINPMDYVGCTLVLDEVCQVLRCLLLNKLCDKDGKRAALLARLEALVKVSSRIIIADADLSDVEIDYLKTLSGDKSTYLIRNDYKSEGYNVRFIKSPNDKAAIVELVEDLRSGHKIMVCTDSINEVKSIAKLIEDLGLNLKVMTVHSENSGDELQSHFIRNINEEVVNYDVLICSPSLGTGVSIEVDHFAKVYGLFVGVLQDSDYCQFLLRVRGLVDRVVWCKNTGLSFSQVSRSTSPKVIKNALAVAHEREIALIRSHLNADIIPFISNGYLFDDNPHIDLFCSYEAEQNNSMYALADNLISRLTHEGHSVDVVDIGDDPMIDEMYPEDAATKKSLKEAKDQVKDQYIQERVDSALLFGKDLKKLERKEDKTKPEKIIVSASRIAEFYAVEKLNSQLVVFDAEGKSREKISQLECLYSEDKAIGKVISIIKKHYAYGTGFGCTWDISKLNLNRTIRVKSGFSVLLNRLTNGDKLTNKDLNDWYEYVKKHADNCTKFGFAAQQKKSAIWLFERWCDQVAIDVSYQRKKVNGDLVETVEIDQKNWEFVRDILDRRSAKFAEFGVDLKMAKNDHLEAQNPCCDFNESDHNFPISLSKGSESCDPKNTQNSPIAKQVDFAKIKTDSTVPPPPQLLPGRSPTDIFVGELPSKPQTIPEQTTKHYPPEQVAPPLERSPLLKEGLRVTWKGFKYVIKGIGTIMACLESIPDEKNKRKYSTECFNLNELVPY